MVIINHEQEVTYVCRFLHRRHCMTLNHHYTLSVEIWSSFKANCAEMIAANRKRSSAIVCDADDAIQGHSMSSIVQIDPACTTPYQHSIETYTSSFNRSRDITPSLHIHTPPLLQVELEKDDWEQVDMFWCQGAQNIGLSDNKLKSALQCIV